MNELLRGVRDFYVAPGAMPVARGVRTLAPAPSVAVLGRAPEAPVLAAALALRLARRGGWPAALVATWGWAKRPPWRLAARPAARRLAARLAADGHEVSASGRLVLLRLPEDAGPAAAAAAAERATGAVRGPVAIGLCAPRDEHVDALLRVQDLIVLALRPDDDPTLAAVAVDSLCALAPPAVDCRSTPGALSRALTLAGIGPAAAVCHELLPALETVR